MSFNDLIKESVKNSPEGSLRRIASSLDRIADSLEELCEKLNQ